MKIETFSATQRREVAVLSDKATRLEGLLARLSQRPEEPVGPAGGIRPWKGVLDWPARGTLTETFGRHRHPKFDAWTQSNGIAIALAAGAPVRAIYAGKAVYAQWLYAWLQAVAVRPGSYVPAGTSVGIVGTGPGREEPGVYFEVRDRQRPSDPVAWLR